MRIEKVCLTVLAAGSILLAACGGADATPVPTTASASSGQPTLEATIAPTIAPTFAPPATDAPTPTSAPPPTTAPTQVPTAAPTVTPVPSPTLVATDTEFFLQLIEPQGEEIITEEPTISVAGRTRVDAVVTVNDTLTEPDIDGLFSSIVELEEGPNIIEVIASVASGEQEELILAVIYIP